MALTACAVVVSAGIFAVPAYAAANVYAVAYSGTNHDLWYYESTTSGSGNHDTRLGMNPYSSPTVAFVTGGEANYEIAFESNANQLWLYDVQNGVGIDTGLAMEPSTTPDIAANDMVAFEGGNGDLWYWNGSGHDTRLGMDSETTSPSITVEGTEIAFQANTHDLWTYNISTGHGVSTALGMDPDSSPSIGNSVSGANWVAFEASVSDDLWYWDGTAGRGLPIRMATETSPSLAPNGGLTAIQSDTGELWLVNVASDSTDNTGLGMAAGTSPDLGISVDAGSGTAVGYQAWFQAAGSHKLWQYSTSTRLGVNASGNISPNSHGVSYTQGATLVVG